MLKFIANTVVTLVKACAVCALINSINSIAYLNYKVSELKGEIEKLKVKG